MDSKVAFVIAIAICICSSAQQKARAQDEINDINQAWVKLYDDKGHKDRRLTVNYPRNISDMDKEKTDGDGKKGFGDKSSSAQWFIPRGWKAVLYDDKNYKSSSIDLLGTGTVQQNPDFGAFSDKCSSLRWDTTNH